MTYTVSITSQGQISIPAKLRKKLGLDKKNQALISESEGRLIIEPVKDVLELEGTFQTNIKAGPKEIREAFEVHLAKLAAKSINE